MFYLAYMFLINDISCFMEIYALSYFNCFLKYFLVLSLVYLFTYLPDRRICPIFVVLIPNPVIFEEESEGTADEPQRLVEWQADNVM